MKKLITSIVAVPILIIFGSAYPAAAAIFFSSGHHTWTDDTPHYDEVFLQNDATLDVIGGSMAQLTTTNNSVANIYGGTVTDGIWAMGDSIVNLYGGTWRYVNPSHNSKVILYAYDVTYDPTGGLYGEGSLQGYFLKDATQFAFSFWNSSDYAHVQIIPEPATLLLLGLGAVLLRNRR